jgi:hypothetical protein
LNTENLEQDLRKTELAYLLKAGLLIHGIQRIPCPNCPFEKEDPPVPLILKDEECFERCPFNIVIWILSPGQEEVYSIFRPDDKKKQDLQMAINAHKIVIMEETIGGVEEQSPLPLFFRKE